MCGMRQKIYRRKKYWFSEEIFLLLEGTIIFHEILDGFVLYLFKFVYSVLFQLHYRVLEFFSAVSCVLNHNP